MRTIPFTSWWLAAAWLLAAPMNPGRAQDAPMDAAWKPRLTALQEEHDAQAGVSVSIVFDDSGSMNENNKLPMAKQAFQSWIEGARDDYRFGLTALNAGVLVPLQRNTRAQVLAAVGKLQARGDTPLARTIARVAADIRKRRASGALYERQVVVVLTDGADNTSRGVSGVQEEMGRLRADNVEVIAFGYQGEGQYMRNSATHFYSPDNARDIARGLNAIDSEVRDTSDVVVDDATRAAMETKPTPTPTPTPGRRSASVTTTATPTPGQPFDPSTPLTAAAPTPDATPTAAPSGRSSGIPWRWVLTMVVIIFVLRRLGGGKRK